MRCELRGFASPLIQADKTFLILDSRQTEMNLFCLMYSSNFLKIASTPIFGFCLCALKLGFILQTAPSALTTADFFKCIKKKFKKFKMRTSNIFNLTPS